jgi:hypothetical protein
LQAEFEGGLFIPFTRKSMFKQKVANPSIFDMAEFNNFLDDLKVLLLHEHPPTFIMTCPRIRPSDSNDLKK